MLSTGCIHVHYMIPEVDVCLPVISMALCTWVSKLQVYWRRFATCMSAAEQPLYRLVIIRCTSFITRALKNSNSDSPWQMPLASPVWMGYSPCICPKALGTTFSCRFPHILLVKITINTLTPSNLLKCHSVLPLITATLNRD